MKTDEIIDWVEILEVENKILKSSNVELILQLRRYREVLESALNILDPEQIRIIQADISDFNYLTFNQNA
jgi:hypothetical protein